MAHHLNVASPHPQAVDQANLAIESRRHGVLVLWSVCPLSFAYSRLISSRQVALHERMDVQQRWALKERNQEPKWKTHTKAGFNLSIEVARQSTETSS